MNEKAVTNVESEAAEENLIYPTFPDSSFVVANTTQRVQGTVAAIPFKHLNGVHYELCGTVPGGSYKELSRAFVNGKEVDPKNVIFEDGKVQLCVVSH